MDGAPTRTGLQPTCAMCPAGSGLHAMVAEVCTSLGGWTATEAALDHEPAAAAAARDRTLLVRRSLTTSAVRFSTHYEQRVGGQVVMSIPSLRRCTASAPLSLRAAQYAARPPPAQCGRLGCSAFL
jgi:hypothetical protein